MAALGLAAILFFGLLLWRRFGRGFAGGEAVEEAFGVFFGEGLGGLFETVVFVFGHFGEVAGRLDDVGGEEDEQLGFGVR